MTSVPIVQIPIDDTAFKKFSEAFEDYRGKLKAMPAAWQATNDRILELVKVQQKLGRSSDDAWKTAVAASAAYEKSVTNAVRAQTGLAAVTHSAGTAMTRMAAAGKALAGHLFGAVRFAAKLATYGIGGGLVGGGGLLFGLDTLAHGVLATQRSARGLGLTPGQFNSFRVNMARYAGTSVLTGAATAQIDPTKWGQLATLGIDPMQAAHESATALSGQEIMAVHRAWRQNPSMLNPAVQAAMQLGFSAGDVRNIGLAHGASLQGAISAAHRDAGAMGFSATVAREWSNFSIQLHKAGVLIETALVNTLAPLAPQLTVMSKDIAGFITGLAQSKDVKVWVGDLEEGLKGLADWLKSPAFRSDMQTMIWYFSKMAHAVGSAARFVFGVPKPPAGAPTVSAVPALPAVGPPSADLVRRAHIMERLGGVNAQDINNLTRSAAAKYHVPLWLLRAQAHIESGYGQHLINMKTGAAGVMQFIPGTARALGITDVLSPTQSIMGAGKLDAALLQKYGGDWRKVIAAYDWGLANVDKDVAAHGKDWLRYAPAETQKYVADAQKMRETSGHDQAMSKMLQRINKRWAGQRQTVVIRNQTAARVAVSANAALP